MVYPCPGCGATDEEKKSCCGNGSEGEELTEEAVGKEEDELKEEFEKE